MVLRSLLLWVEQEDQEMRKIDQGELFIYLSFALAPDNSCSIYETRPTICRISEMQKETGLSQVEYFQLTASVCNLWMDEDKSEYPRLEDEYSDYIIDSQPDD